MTVFFKSGRGLLSETVFAYGPLCDDRVRSRLFGAGDGDATVARLPGVELVAPDGWPAPRLSPRGDGAVPGALITLPRGVPTEVLTTLMGPEREVTVETSAGPRVARLFGREGQGAPWDADAWRNGGRAVFLAMLDELIDMGVGGMPSGLLRRAVARVAAKQGAPARLRSAFGSDALDWQGRERLHAGFFTLDRHSYRQRRFDGEMSETVVREVFFVGDAVTVLPWDPATDRVLLIEQMRAGLVGRGDPNPMNLEVVAGLRDRVESPEETARREAREEAGLELGRMVQVAAYYPSPGAMTEFITSFIAEADLSRKTEGLHGLDSEHEDIRTLILPREEAMAALERGEARNAPLMIALYELERRRAELAESWG